MMKLTAKAKLQIRKPVDVVFDAIANPDHLTGYFISKSSGPMEVGQELIWEFDDFPGSFPVKVTTLKTNELITFVWDPETQVDIQLQANGEGNTIVSVSEGEKELNEQNLKWLISNTSGWANFLDCLKAYLEYGIRLREGAYDYMKPKNQ